MRQLTDSQKQRVRDLLAELVHIDSAVSSQAQARRDRTEERIAAFLTDHLAGMGMMVERQEVEPGRPNLMAHWPDQTGAASLMLEAHMDTVTVEGMIIEPFRAQIRDGRMYGRGACDTKGGMAAFLTALALAREEGRLPADKLYFVATMSEETGCHGAAALMEHGFRTTAAIVGEPTRCEVVTCHKAPLWLEVQTRGRSCHASMPECGRNAIEVMARVVDFVHGPWTAYLGRRTHALLGRSTAVVTQIDGGSKINIVPARCRARIDSRLVPDWPNTEVMADFERMLTEHVGGSGHCEVAIVESQPGLDTDAGVPLATKLLHLCQEANGQDTPRGVNYFADTGPFSQAGITSVLFGPGDIAQAHTADEYLDLEQLYQATEVTLTLLTEHAGRSVVSSID